MPRSTQHPTKSALTSGLEMQTAIGQQLRAVSELPQEISHELAAPPTARRLGKMILMRTSSARVDASR